MLPSAGMAQNEADAKAGGGGSDSGAAARQAASDAQNRSKSKQGPGRKGRGGKGSAHQTEVVVGDAHVDMVRLVRTERKAEYAEDDGPVMVRRGGDQTIHHQCMVCPTSVRRHAGCTCMEPLGPGEGRSHSPVPTTMTASREEWVWLVGGNDCNEAAKVGLPGRDECYGGALVLDCLLPPFAALLGHCTHGPYWYMDMTYFIFLGQEGNCVKLHKPSESPLSYLLV